MKSIGFAAIAVCCWAGSARAQSAATCAFDAGTAALTVTVNGTAARLQAVHATGEIVLDGAACGGATVTSTDTIQVTGGTLDDRITLSGAFAPGLSAEADGNNEIEVSFDLGLGTDHATLALTNAPDRVIFTANGIDLGGDLDEDLTTAGIERLVVDSNGGNDVVDASVYTGTPHGGGGPGGTLDVRGGRGNDQLTGDGQVNHLYGEDGDDVLVGGQGRDRLHGDDGDDILDGGAGDDYLYGGTGIDVVDYSSRTNPLTVRIGGTSGEAGEPDFVDASVENVIGGSGDDIMFGNDVANTLIGGGGDDEIHGGGGDDVLDGDVGSDYLSGDAGLDELYGGVGDDTLDGRGGADELFGGDGNDTLDGGGGIDLYFGDSGDDVMANLDGLAETVDCGDGTADDAEPDPLDTLIGCEL
jgi:Ca2+-binding RTX toxin-like protein